MGDIPDTGLFRPCLTKFAADPAEILSPASNRLWNAKLVSSIERQAASASPEQLDILRGVERQTRKELSQKGTHGPLSRPPSFTSALGKTCGVRPGGLVLHKGCKRMALQR